MSLREQLEQADSSYLAGTITVQGLQTWLASHAQTIADDPDEETRRLSGHVWILLSELGYGHRDEASVRSDLASYIGGLEVA